MCSLAIVSELNQLSQTVVHVLADQLNCPVHGSEVSSTFIYKLDYILAISITIGNAVQLQLFVMFNSESKH